MTLDSNNKKPGIIDSRPCFAIQEAGVSPSDLEGAIMSRYYIDCRDFPGDVKCTVALAADTKEELLEAVVEHGRTVHGYVDTPEFRNQILQGMKEGTPPLKVERAAAA